MRIKRESGRKRRGIFPINRRMLDRFTRKWVKKRLFSWILRKNGTLRGNESGDSDWKDQRGLDS